MRIGPIHISFRNSAPCISDVMDIVTLAHNTTSELQNAVSVATDIDVLKQEAGTFANNLHDMTGRIINDLKEAAEQGGMWT